MPNFLLAGSILALAAVVAAGAVDNPGKTPMSAESKRVRWAKAPPGRQNSCRVSRMKDNPQIDADWNKPAWKEVSPLTLEYYMGDEPVHQPLTQVKIAYDDRALYLIWRVEDRFVRARHTRHGQDVYKDSCVEFFFTPGGDPVKRGYFNLETNCAGAKLFGVHVQEGPGGRFTAEEFSSISTATSLQGPIDPEIAGPTTWTLEYRIPFDILEKRTKLEPPAPGVKWRANFYKCADQSSHPHWLTWSPVTNPEPDFHLPKFFGTIEFE